MRPKLTLSLALVALCLFVTVGVLLYLRTAPVPIDNITQLDQITNKEHDLEELLLAEAIFYVRSGFENVTANSLANEVGLKLECRRQVSQTDFYYVVKGAGYRCFLFTDVDDVVQDVLVAKDFEPMAQVQEYIADYGKEQWFSESIENWFYKQWRDVGYSSAVRNRMVILLDGTLIVQTMGTTYTPSYVFYTDEEWQDLYKEYDAFMILPIDKQ